MPRILKLIPFFFTCAMFLKALFEIQLSNFNTPEGDINYILSDSVYIGGLALLIVGVSIFLKNNIWNYLFIFTLLLSFSELVNFSNSVFYFGINDFQIDVMILMILIFHLALNLSDIQIPELSPKEAKEKQRNKTNRFIEKYSKKSHEQLLKLDSEDLVPEAREALNQLLKKK